MPLVVVGMRDDLSLCPVFGAYGECCLEWFLQRLFLQFGEDGERHLYVDQKIAQG